MKMHCNRMENRTTRKLSNLALAGFLLTSSCTSEPAPPQPQFYMTEPTNFVMFTRTGTTTPFSIAEDQLILTFQSTASADSRTQVQNWLSARGVNLVGRAPGTMEILQYQIRHGDDLNAILDYLQSQAAVSMSMPNEEVFQLRDPNPNFTGNAANGLWWVDNIHLRQAWDATTGSSTIPIGIVDGGIYTGQGNFNGKTITIGAPCLHSDGRVYYQQLATSDTSCSPYAGDFHGTAVAYVAASRGDDGIGGVGIAWQNPIISVALSTPRQTQMDLNEATLLAISMGAKVVNISRGPGCAADGPTCNQGEMTRFRLGILPSVLEAQAQNVFVVLAAGNSGFKYDNQWLPTERATSEVQAFQSNVLDVGGTDDWDNPACAVDYDSALGICTIQRTTHPCDCPNCLSPSPGQALTAEGNIVEISAPAYRISVPDITQRDGSLTIADPMGRIIAGTSLATPMVSGAAALVWGLHPTYTAQQVKSVLLNTARTAGCRTVGHGILDVAAAVNAPTMTVSTSATSYRSYGLGYFNRILSLSSDSFVLGGANLASNNIRFVDVHANGDIIWDQDVSFTGSSSIVPEIDGVFAMTRAANGDIIAVGDITNSDMFGTPGFVLRLNPAGSVVWQDYEEDTAPISVWESGDGNIHVLYSQGAIINFSSTGTQLPLGSMPSGLAANSLAIIEYQDYLTVMGQTLVGMAGNDAPSIAVLPNLNSYLYTNSVIRTAFATSTTPETYQRSEFLFGFGPNIFTDRNTAILHPAFRRSLADYPYDPSSLVTGYQLHNLTVVNDGLVVTATEPSGMQYRVFETQIDFSGNPQWTHSSNYPYANVVADLQRTSDGGTAFAGVNYSSSDHGNPWLFKVDSSGRPLWEQTFAFANLTTADATSLASTGSGFMLAGGFTDDSGMHPFVLITDPQGNSLNH